MSCVNNVYFPLIKPNVDDEYEDYSDEDYKDYDECKGGSFAVKDFDNNTMSIHDKFKDVEEISKNDMVRFLDKLRTEVMIENILR